MPQRSSLKFSRCSFDAWNSRENHVRGVPIVRRPRARPTSCSGASASGRPSPRRNSPASMASAEQFVPACPLAPRTGRHARRVPVSMTAVFDIAAGRIDTSCCQFRRAFASLRGRALHFAGAAPAAGCHAASGGTRASGPRAGYEARSRRPAESVGRSESLCRASQAGLA